MTVLSPSGLETFDYGTPGWQFIYNRNMDLLENLLLKLSALGDVDVTGIQDGETIQYNSSTLKWERKT